MKGLEGLLKMYKNKYTLLIWLKALKGKAIQEVYEWVRNDNKTLKLICFGRKDILLTESALN
jgi:hypothetical protein